MKTAKAFAPATVANVAVGFDLLGFSVEGVGDTIEIKETSTPGVKVVACDHPKIPLESDKNTAAVAVQKLVEAAGYTGGLEISIKKGIPLGSGMGGSASSAVGAVVAADKVVGKKFSQEELFSFAISGERVASGAMHGDNVAPCLYGGLVAVLSLNPIEVLQLPIPKNLHCLLIHPQLEILTSESRQSLRKEIMMAEHTLQSAQLAGFMAGLYTNDYGLIRRSMSDLIVEPQRSPTIPNFKRAKQVAMRGGALGFSISGSGPSLFGWFETKAAAEKVQKELLVVFDEVDLTVKSWVFPLSQSGAKVITG